MAGKRWLLLPFGGGEFKGLRNPRGKRPDKKPSTGGDGNGKDIDASATHESAREYAEKSEEDVVQDYNAPMRWWVLTTLFPLTAGTFGPIANAFNLCAVIIPWRTYVSPTSTEAEGQHISDPKWLIAVNAISLTVALIANLSLLGQMTNRVRFAIANTVTIVGWWLAGLVDLGVVLAARSTLPLPATDADGSATYSQAFYYACFATFLYLMLAVQLTLTAIAIRKYHLGTEFKLTLSQRSLMMQTMLFLAYLLSAAAVYAYVEDWDYLDAVYWGNVTFFTIGFGDYTPVTHLGRSLFFPTAVGGILFVGLIIADIRSLVLESASVKISTRMIEKARHKALISGDPANGHYKIGGVHKRQINANSELERREQEFEIMREILAQAAKDNKRITLVISGFAFFVLWILGAVVFWQAESKATGGDDWTYFESLYFTYVSLLTVGYGDFEVNTNSGKPAFVFWALIALPTLTVLIGSIGDAVSDFSDAAVKTIGNQGIRLGKWFKSLRTKLDTEISPSTTLSTGDSLTLQEIESQSLETLSHQEAHETLNRRLPPPKDSIEHDLRSRRAAAAAGFAYRPYMVIQQIRKCFADLEEEPAKKYTFKEWAWILKLLDEDESDPKGHRVPGRSGVDQKRSEKEWSWMGQESPLMSMDSEAKWALTRLVCVLEEELKERGDRHVLERCGHQHHLVE